MENKKSLWPFAFTYGSAMGLLSVILSVIFYILLPIDPETMTPKWGWVQTVASLVVIGLFMIWTTVKYRNEELDGNISYGKSLGFAMALALPFAVITAIYTFVFFKFIEPDMMARIAEKQMEKMAEKGMSDEQIEQSMVWMNRFTSPLVSTLFGLVGAVFQIALIGLITSIFTKKVPVENAE